MLKLNVMLTNRGFANITKNFGKGKLKAQWIKVDPTVVVVTREKEGKKTRVHIETFMTDKIFYLPDNELSLKRYIIENFKLLNKEE